MARRVTVELADDIDGSLASQTVTFAVRGVDYEIDLSDENAASFDEALEPFIAHARRAAGLKGSAGRAGGIDPKAVRAWASEQGIELGLRGRLPRQIVEQYCKVA